MMGRALYLTLAFILTLLSACGTPPQPAPPPPPPPPEQAPPPVTDAADALQPVPSGELPSLVDDGDRESLLLALARNRDYLGRLPAERSLTFGARTVSAGELREAYDRFAGYLTEERTPESLAAQVAYTFDVYRSVGGASGAMLVTGYFVPRIAASLRRSTEYNVPIYGPPGDVFRIDLSEFSEKYKGVKISGRLVGNRLLPYPDRREIREKALLRGHEIAWARDIVDVFFLEIQGSGILQLQSGREIGVGYAGANGRQYRSIGRLLIDGGSIERKKVSMQSIRRYLAENPEKVEEILDYNESTVFFRRLQGEALGNLGVPVTGGRSIATDHQLFPRGALGFLVSEVPATAEDGTTIAAGPLRRYVLNQDTGGAIRGAGRVDFFWGRGEEAAQRAGLMKQPGQLYFLLPKVPGVGSPPREAQWNLTRHPAPPGRSSGFP